MTTVQAEVPTSQGITAHESEGLKAYRDHLLGDAGARLGYQHDFAQSALKGLILINGGAVVALLALVSQPAAKVAVPMLQLAFVGYASGLVATVLAYVLAYLSQGLLMNDSYRQAAHLHAKITDAEALDLATGARVWGMRVVYASIACAALALAGFIVGSACALYSIR